MVTVIGSGVADVLLEREMEQLSNDCRVWRRSTPVACLSARLKRAIAVDVRRTRNIKGRHRELDTLDDGEGAADELATRRSEG